MAPRRVKPGVLEPRERTATTEGRTARGATGQLRCWPHAEQPPVIEAAVQAYVGQQLPGGEVPSAPAPDLAELELVQVGASVGRLAGTPVMTFAYRQGGAEPLFVYVCERTFPTAQDATLVSGADGAWIAQDGEVTLLCAQLPRDLLIVGDDEALVRAVARTLGIG